VLEIAISKKREISQNIGYEKRAVAARLATAEA
jgi:hypothetical protein